jgi:hypothetical protein
MFDLNNFVIDRIVRGVALSQKDDSVLFSINQIQNASLNCASESADAVDALGTPIATFYRAKSAEFSAENALFDMNLMATQLGTKKKVAAAGAKITVPAMESFTVVEGGKYDLKHSPKVAPAEIYALNGDSTFGTKYVKATSASATEFSIADKTISVQVEVKDKDGNVTTPGIPVGTEMFVMYEYETENAVEVVNSAKEFPVGCKFIMEVLGCDVCDQTNLIYAYVIFNNFKLSPDFDWSIATDGAHPFSGKAQQDYCDKEKRLFSIVIPGDE